MNKELNFKIEKCPFSGELSVIINNMTVKAYSEKHALQIIDKEMKSVLR